MHGISGAFNVQMLNVFHGLHKIMLTSKCIHNGIRAINFTLQNETGGRRFVQIIDKSFSIRISIQLLLLFSTEEKNIYQYIKRMKEFNLL